jgi:hypothetical protein
VLVAAASETESRNTSKTLAWDVKIDFDPPRKGAYYSQAPSEWYDSQSRSYTTTDDALMRTRARTGVLCVEEDEHICADRARLAAPVW